MTQLMDVLFLVLTFLIQLLFWTFFIHNLGRELVAEWRKSLTGGRLYLTAQESCCTQVVLFPADTAGTVVDFLRSRDATLYHAKDHMLDELPRVTGLEVFQSDTNVALHIGQYSSLRFGSVPDRFL